MHSVDHAQTRAQNRNYCNAFFGDFILRSDFERGFNSDGHKPYVAHAFVRHYGCNFLDKLAELLHARFFVAQYRYFVFN